jgi:hypothetical protein
MTMSGLRRLPDNPDEKGMRGVGAQAGSARLAAHDVALPAA